MSLILPINIDDLLNCRGVESARVEFKASWDHKSTGFQALKTICAYANDFLNLNGGYIIIGVEEQNGVAVFPLKGMSPEEIAEAQKWLRGRCNNIDPKYQPVFSPEVVQGKHILVIWAPGSETRPHSAPDGDRTDKKYFIRLGSETVDAAKNGMLEQLLQMTARVPFDDRRAHDARIEAIREAKVREFLSDIKSGLIEENHTKELYRKLRIAAPVNGYDVPKNIGLLLFSQNPEEWFTGAKIEVVQYIDDTSGNILEEKVFSGGIHEQLRSALTYLEGFSSSHFEKQRNKFLVKGWVSYPIPALREALVNAVYHRNYDSSNPEPVKVHLFADRIEIISYPGPVPAIGLEHLNQKLSMPPVPARNRRVGEFLKELRLAEGRGTGLPKLYRVMRENGSLEPRFDFDEGRTYFRVTLPAHPEFIAIGALRDAAHLRAIGDDSGSLNRIKAAWQQMVGSPSLSAEYIRLLSEKGRLSEAESVFSEFQKKAYEGSVPLVTNVLIEAFINSGQKEGAKKYLNQLPQFLDSKDALDSAILYRRLMMQQKAHQYFEKAREFLLQDTRAMHEFAQTKMELAKEAWKLRNNKGLNRRLLGEAKELLERVLQMEADKVRHAWVWRDLARVKHWLRIPRSESIEAYDKAISLLPDEVTFLRERSQLTSDSG